MSGEVIKKSASVIVTKPRPQQGTVELIVTAEHRPEDGWTRAMVYSFPWTQLVLKTSWQRKREYILEELTGDVAAILSGAGPDGRVNYAPDAWKDAGNVTYAFESAWGTISVMLGRDLDSPDPEQEIEDPDEFNRVMDELNAKFAEWNAGDPKEERL